MKVKRIIGETLSIALAALTLGCSQPPARDGGEDPNTSAETSSETGEDTDSTPAECPTTDLGLSLHQGLDGESISTVMLPATRGGADDVTGSCGGAGIEAAYRVSSHETGYYNVWVDAQELGTATFHVHAGDSCHGPELDCATGPHVEFALMLAAGETVTLVVDTEPGLAIPEEGLLYSVGITLGSPPPEPCYPDELHACTEAPAAALQSCMAGYTCGDFGQAAMCIDALGDALQPCFDEFCPDGPESIADACGPACDTRRASCETEDGCDASTCDYEWQTCMDTCTPCTHIAFQFEYAAGCELAMPGPPGPEHYVSLEIAGEIQLISEPGLACGDPEASDVVWQTASTLLLCAPACEAFAMGGTAEVTYGSPPCE
jgi:hypothetical protein